MMHISYMYLLQRILKLAIFYAKIAPTDHGFWTPVPSPRMFWIQVPPWSEYQDSDTLKAMKETLQKKHIQDTRRMHCNRNFSYSMKAVLSTSLSSGWTAFRHYNFKDISFAEDHLLRAFSKKSETPVLAFSFLILMTQTKRLSAKIQRP